MYYFLGHKFLIREAYVFSVIKKKNQQNETGEINYSYFFETQYDKFY